MDGYGDIVGFAGALLAIAESVESRVRGLGTGLKLDRPESKSLACTNLG
jgi:hypothetical protein